MRPTVLGDCRAVLFARTPAQMRSLTNLAGKVGFGSTTIVYGDNQGATKGALQHSAPFFLAHHRLSDKTKASIVMHLRCSDDDAVRFAPIILISDDGPLDVLLRYVRLSFDDVITLPEKRTIVVDRLQQQLNREVSYIETKSYLGPDRDRLEVVPRETHASADAPVLKLKIRRTTAQGITVVSRQLFGLPTAKQVKLVS